MAKFIAFSGKKQSGKDTAATIVYNILNALSLPVDIGPAGLYKHSAMAGYRCKPFHFAKPLKDMVNLTLGIPQELLWGSDEDKETLTHVMWEGFPVEVRFKYSLDGTEPCLVDGCLKQPRPRTGPMTVREVLQIMGTDIFRERVYGEVWSEAPFRQQWREGNVVLLPDCRFPNEKKIVEDNDGIVIRINRTRSKAMDLDMHASEVALDDAEFEWVYQNDGTLEELEYWLKSVLIYHGLAQ